MASDDVDVVIWAATASAQFLQQIATALVSYKATGKLPGDLAAMMAAGLPGLKKRGAKKLKLNKDGTEKQPRKPTAYNAWMQGKLKELKEAADHDPNQKHVDTFKQAAQIWAAMPDDEKKKFTEDYKEKHKDEDVHGNGVGSVEPELAAVVAAAANSEESDEEDAVPAVTLAKRPVPASSSEEESSDDEEGAPPAKKTAPAPKPTPKPAPAPMGEPASKKKKKRKEQAAAKPETPIVSPTTDGEKRKKKKKKSALAD